MSSDLLIRNARIVNPWEEVSADVLVARGRIARVADSVSTEGTVQVLDASGRVVLPGFIDVHIQGANGADFLDGREDTLAKISGACTKFGVTGFLATTVYKPGLDNTHIRALVEGRSGDGEGARLLGIHLEGPFISSERRGMIQESSISRPSPAVLSQILQACQGALGMMTIAPELKGVDRLISNLLQHQVVPSFGHSSATYEQTAEAIKAGVHHVTHLYNAMPPIHHRAPGPLPAIFESREVTAQLIADGVHIHPRMVRFAAELLGEDRLILITDGVRSTGLPDGTYLYDGLEYLSSQGTAAYRNGTLIGTSAGMAELARRFMLFTGWGLRSVAKIASYNPAQLLGLQLTKGSVEVGKDADLVIADENLKVSQTIVGGRLVHSERA